MRRQHAHQRTAFTLIELLVVVSIIAMLIAILLPSMQRAREQAKAVKCLANLKEMSNATMIYASLNQDRLPGSLHPAVYRNQGLQYLTDQTNPLGTMSFAGAKHSQGRQLTYVLSSVLSDSSEGKQGVRDYLTTCPCGLPDSHFYEFKAITGKAVYPLHYVINNVGELDPSGQQTGALNNVRLTNPMYYFGFSPWAGAGQDIVNAARKWPPQPLSRIHKANQEWMVAGAWYRPRTNAGFPELQQEGPYQVSWSGEAMEFFPRHFKPNRRGYSFTSSAARDTQLSIHRNQRQDGVTNSAFFDGHAAGVKSKSLIVNNFNLLYGFKGTVNPWTPFEAQLHGARNWEWK
jgi:prepilin-type N-terminal cleavage/methylation domain-containing protein/prepilin-type processing-associated H-X9-DG protein